MPLIMLTGYPCSGLSYRAKQLAELLEETQNQLFDALEKNTSEDNATNPKDQKRFSFHIVPSHDPSHPRTVYDHARTEKEARAVAYARVKRALAKDAFVILDGMNYIKGYRYQLWCEAKAVGTTCCVVHIGTPIDKCIAINNSRLRRGETSSPPVCNNNGQSQSPLPETTETVDDLAEPDSEEPYPSALHNNLIFRYEEPTVHSRWDRPLFTVPWTDARPPIEEIWNATTGIEIEKNSTATQNSLAALLHTNPDSKSLTNSPPVVASPAPAQSDTASVAFTIRSTTPGNNNTAGRLGRPRIKPHQATLQPAQADSGALYSYEKRTSAIITSIRNFTQSNPSASAALAQQLAAKGTIRANEQGITIPLPADISSIPVFVPAHVVQSASTDELAGAGGILTLPRLQRLRRQWISQNRVYIGMTHHTVQGSFGIDQIGDAFVRYLNFEFADEGTE